MIQTICVSELVFGLLSEMWSRKSALFVYCSPETPYFVSCGPETLTILFPMVQNLCSKFYPEIVLVFPTVGEYPLYLFPKQNLLRKRSNHAILVKCARQPMKKSMIIVMMMEESFFHHHHQLVKLKTMLQ